MKQIVTSMSFVFDPGKHTHHPTGKSLTVPDQSLTVRQLFERYRVGRPLPDMGEGVFTGDGEESFVDIERMDKLQKLDFKRQLDDYVDEKSTELREAREARARELYDAKERELEELRKFREARIKESESGA